MRMLPVETSVDTDLTQLSSLTALVQPARTHTEVIIVAVAARDKKKAEAYAKAYDIPIVHENYDSKCVFCPSLDGFTHSIIS